MVVLPVSIISIITLVAHGIHQVAKRQEPDIQTRLVRPCLAILVCALVLYNHHRSFELAQAHAIELARSAQAWSVQNGRCPESIGGWTNTTRAFLSDDVFFSGHIRRLGISYPAHYRAAPDGKTFALILVRGFNMQTTITGGVNTELRARYSDEVHARDVSAR